jgi:hypothetical protein
MNKEELLKDLAVLQQRHQKLLGAIEYIISKIQEFDKLEELKKEDIKKSEPETEEERLK